MHWKVMCLMINILGENTGNICCYSIDIQMYSCTLFSLFGCSSADVTNVKVLKFTRVNEGSIHRSASSAKAASLRRDDVQSLQLSSLPATLTVSRRPLLLANLHELSYVTT